MPRIRTIKPKFWDDTKLAKISMDARLLFIGLWNFCDDLGVIISDQVWLKSKVFPYDKIQIQQFDKWIQELVKNGFISPISHKGEMFYYLPNLTRHQIINRPNLDDVFISSAILTRLLEESLINHGSITDESVPEGRGKERSGKDSKGEETPEVFFPFESEKFENHWELWKKYRREHHNFSYKTNISEQAALKNLGGLAKNEDDAIKIIEQSMANGWQGFFELKNIKKNESKLPNISREGAKKFADERGYN